MANAQVARIKQQPRGPRLTQVRLQVGAVAHTSTAAGCCTLEVAEVGTGLRASRAVDELVAVPAAASATGALEHTGIHARGAGGADDGHVAAVHVDFSADIDDRVRRAEGGLTPGVKDLAVDEGRGAVNCRPGTTPAGWEGDGSIGARRDRDGDLGLNSVDPGTGGTPDGQDHVVGGRVEEGVGELATSANPRSRAAGDGVQAKVVEA